jgi:nucleoid DNA-binding protein
LLKTEESGVDGMNKKEMIYQLADTLQITKKQAALFVNAFLDKVEASLYQGEPVTFVGFGAFGVRKRAERQARNPITGEAIYVPAKTVPYFSAGQGLREAVRQTVINVKR